MMCPNNSHGSGTDADLCSLNSSRRRSRRKRSSRRRNKRRNKRRSMRRSRRRRPRHRLDLNSMSRRLYGNTAQFDVGPPVGTVQQRSAVTVWVGRKINGLCCCFFIQNT